MGAESRLLSVTGELEAVSGHWGLQSFLPGPPLGDPQALPHFSASSLAGTDMAVFCLLCGKRFQTQTALQQHMEVHAGVRSYICSECNRTFPSHTALKRHLRSHTGTAEATEAVLHVGLGVPSAACVQGDPIWVLSSELSHGWSWRSVLCWSSSCKEGGTGLFLAKLHFFLLVF